MIGVLEQWANQIGWQLAKGNVVVEGESDVFYLEHAARLFEKEFGTDPLGPDLSIIAAGQGAAGGVDGVNERFRIAHQLARLDVMPDGAFKYRFIGLFDNDIAGKRAFERGARFSQQIKGYRDLFLLHPVMPRADGSDPAAVESRAISLNKQFRGLHWEIEDLLSAEIFAYFESEHASEVIRATTVCDRTHRDLTWDGKVKLRRCVQDYADLNDMIEFIRLICILRNYLRLRSDHVERWLT